MSSLNRKKLFNKTHAFQPNSLEQIRMNAPFEQTNNNPVFAAKKEEKAKLGKSILIKNLKKKSSKAAD